MGSSPPLLVVVTGAPATGKTQAAEELARRLRIPFISKDTLKEALYDTLGWGDDVEDALERAALAVLFSVVESQLEAGVSVVAESNFDANTDIEPFRRLFREREPRLVQVHCRSETEELLERFARRAESGGRHPGHRDARETVDEVRERLERGDWEPLDLPGDLIQVEVRGGVVDYDALIAEIRAAA